MLLRYTHSEPTAVPNIGYRPSCMEKVPVLAVTPCGAEMANGRKSVGNPCRRGKAAQGAGHLNSLKWGTRWQG